MVGHMLSNSTDVHLSNHWFLSSLLLLRDLPKTSALHYSDPITLNRLQTDTKNTDLWENASFPSAVHHSILIAGCGLQENWFAVMTILWVATRQFFFSFLLLHSFTRFVVVPQFRPSVVCVWVGCTKENKGFAGIRPLQQTNGSKKLAVAPSDTWSAFNLAGAKGDVGGGRGHCFRVIIFKSLGQKEALGAQWAFYLTVLSSSLHFQRIAFTQKQRERR